MTSKERALRALRGEDGHGPDRVPMYVTAVAEVVTTARPRLSSELARASSLAMRATW